MKHFRILLNPFEKLSEYAALLVGLAAIFPLCLISARVGGMFCDIMYFSGNASDIPITKILALYFSMYILTAMLFWGFGKLLSKSRVRLIDVFGYVFFAFTPLIFVPVCFIPESSRILLSPPQQYSPEWWNAHFTLPAKILVFSSVAFFAWSWILLFNALKVSANLGGWRLWLSYIGGMSLSKILTETYIFPAIIFFPIAYCAQNHTPLSPSASAFGMYEGALNFPGQTLRFRLYIDDGDKIKLHAASPDQNDSRISIENFNITRDCLRFSIPTLRVEFDGGFASEDGTQIAGIFSQYAYKIPLKLEKKKEYNYTAECALNFEIGEKILMQLKKIFYSGDFKSEILSELNGKHSKAPLRKNSDIAPEIIAENDIKLTLDAGKGIVSCTSKFAGAAKLSANLAAMKLASILKTKNSGRPREMGSVPLGKSLVDLNKNTGKTE